MGSAHWLQCPWLLNSSLCKSRQALMGGGWLRSAPDCFFSGVYADKLGEVRFIGKQKGCYPSDWLYQPLSGTCISQISTLKIKEI